MLRSCSMALIGSVIALSGLLAGAHVGAAPGGRSALPMTFRRPFGRTPRTAVAPRAGRSSSDWPPNRSRTGGRTRPRATAAAGQLEQAIALWEEILPRATSPDYRRAMTPQLALAYLRLADLREQQGKLGETEAALGKAIAHGETALALGPDRPLLVRDNLEVARQMLTGLRERAHREAIDRLTGAGRWADAEAAHRRGIAEQEERAKGGPGREVAARILADRLDRFAWFLAHCPAPGVRDPKAAVRHARRATELQPATTAYWFTLAVAQHRNGDWRDSQASLGEVTARAGGLDGGGWFLTAMNLHHLRQPADARAAFQRGVEWTAERQRQAEGDPVLRFQFELMRPALEALRREAERLLDGKDPSGDRIG